MRKYWCKLNVCAANCLIHTISIRLYLYPRPSIHLQYIYISHIARFLSIYINIQLYMPFRCAHLFAFVNNEISIKQRQIESGRKLDRTFYTICKISLHTTIESDTFYSKYYEYICLVSNQNNNNTSIFIQIFFLVRSSISFFIYSFFFGAVRLKENKLMQNIKYRFKKNSEKKVQAR